MFDPCFSNQNRPRILVKSTLLVSPKFNDVPLVLGKISHPPTRQDFPLDGGITEENTKMADRAVTYLLCKPIAACRIQVGT